jgi:hypothetical protein
MNASIAATFPGFERSTPVGPPLLSIPSVPDRFPPVPDQGPAVERSGGPSTPLARCVGDVDEFAAQYWGRRPLVHTPTGGDRHPDVHRARSTTSSRSKRSMNSSPTVPGFQPFE